MKKIIALACLVSLIIPARACDICGHSLNPNPYFFPQLSRNYLGLTYLQRRLDAFDPFTGGTERSAQLLFRHSINSRLQLAFTAPYVFRCLHTTTGTQQLQGLGDATILAYYQLLKKPSHQLLLGAGLKLPTGSFNRTTINKEKLAPQLQPGTGSLDYLVSANYQFTHNHFFANAAASYQYTTQNKNDFRFGDLATINIAAGLRKELNRSTLTPYILVSGESQLPESNQHEISTKTIHSFNAGAGLDLMIKNITVGVNLRIPLSKQNEPLFSAHCFFSL